MEFKGSTYVRFDEPSVVNYCDAVIRKIEPIRTEFKPVQYRKLVHTGLCYISKTQLVAEIYELAKEET